jgi:hypothetical protein
MIFDVLETDRIRPLLEEGIVKAVDASNCQAFDEYICQAYPWAQFTDRIDWSLVKTPYKRFSWREATAEESSDFIKTTCLKKFNEVCIVYGANKRGLLVDFNYTCQNLENLVVFSSATYFIVGATRNVYGLIKLEHDSFIEVDSVRWLTASS